MEYKHFSHQHNLNMYKVQPGQQFHCSGCESPCSDSIYACWQCNYFLHEHCGNANRYVKHPSHPLHPLILVPYPTYSSGSFFCNACGGVGSAFSYCCALCEVDLHVHCAFLPQKVNHKVHAHQLFLSHTIPEDQKESPKTCKICNKQLDSKNWSYCCFQCDIRVHTFCATKEVKGGLYQMDEPTESAVEGTSSSQQNEKVTCEVQPEPELSEDELMVQLYKLKLQMQMADQAALIASFNLSNHV